MTTLTPSPVSPPDLLAELLAALPVVPKTPRGKTSSRKPLVPDERPLAQSFAIRKTGYVTWKPVSRVLQVQEQICKCCGSSIEYIKSEHFALENGTAHATWLRTEGYGIEAPDDLPNTFVDLEPIYISACPQCRSTPFDDLEALFHPRQLSLTL